MAFIPSSEYWARKIKNIELAIEGSEKSAREATEERAIIAHTEYAKSCRKALAKANADFCAWRNKRQNIERGARNY